MSNSNSGWVVVKGRCPSIVSFEEGLDLAFDGKVTCKNAGVARNHVYTTRTAAQNAANRLARVSRKKFSVVEVF